MGTNTLPGQGSADRWSVALTPRDAPPSESVRAMELASDLVASDIVSRWVAR